MRIQLACPSPSKPYCPHGVLTPLTPLAPAPAGDIGGQMGLFIGASILTVLELFDYAYEVSGGGARRRATWGRGPARPPAPSRS